VYAATRVTASEQQLGREAAGCTILPAIWERTVFPICQTSIISKMHPCCTGMKEKIVLARTGPELRYQHLGRWGGQKTNLFTLRLQGW